MTSPPTTGRTSELSSRLPGYVRVWLGLWVAAVALVFAIAGVPAVRRPWTASLMVGPVAPGVLLSEPIANFTNPYVSFVRFHVQTGIAPADAQVPFVLLGGGLPSGFNQPLDAQTLVAASMEIDPAQPMTLMWNAERAIQFRPSDDLRVMIRGPDGNVTGEVTVGYDGKSPTVTVLRYWWPWLMAMAVAGFLFLLSPRTWPFQLRGFLAIGELVPAHRPLALLLVAAALVRLVLVVRGGQYFDWDEHRYGVGATFLFDRLSTGNFTGALDLLLRSPDHPGFRIVGMVPAFFHVLSAAGTGQPISEMRYPSGEWLPAFLLSLSSVWSIGLTYALARRTGGTHGEAFLAAFLMFASVAMLIHARHFFPYDAALALSLFALWIGLKATDHPIRSCIAGALCGLAFLTYEGYWLLVCAVGAAHVFRRPVSVASAVRRALIFGTGFATLPALLIGAGALRGRAFLHETLKFAQTATHGDFSEGWSLPWMYLWDVDHGLLIVLLLGIAVMIYRVRAGSPRGLLWLSGAGAIYLALIIGSNLLQTLTVYDRLARQMLPFLCLAAAAGLVQLKHRRLLFTAIALCLLANVWPLVAQRFPREIVREVVATHGRANLRLDSTVRQAVDSTSSLFLPLGADIPGPKRYVLLNARDIWLERPAELAARPPGTVLMSATHPRQLRSMQYHGYTPEQRRFVRSHDISMQLIDVQPGGPTTWP